MSESNPFNEFFTGWFSMLEKGLEKRVCLRPGCGYEETREIPPEQLPAPGGPCHTCSECGIRCGAGRSCFALDWKGNLMPCGRLDMIQGHPLEEGFKAAWARVNKWSNEWQRVPECSGCAYEGICARPAYRLLPNPGNSRWNSANEPCIWFSTVYAIFRNVTDTTEGMTMTLIGGIPVSPGL